MTPIAKSNHDKAAACLPPLLDKTTASQVGFLQEQVSRHLRVISEVNSTTYFTTTTVSEPPLSLAVASLLRGKGPNASLQSSEQWSDNVEIFAEAQKTVGLMLGEEEEECVRLLCSLRWIKLQRIESSVPFRAALRRILNWQLLLLSAIQFALQTG